jgi:hypothetical protein
MTELSNAVTVLIARMESHPEDFETYGKARFSMMANGLMGLVGVDKEHHAAFWFLSDADRQALAEAWKKFHYAKWEKHIMETIFDDGAEEREREMERVKMKQQMYQAQQAAMSSRIHPMQNSYPYTANVGLLGSGGNAAQGLTVHSNGAVQMSNTLSLGGETIDSSILKKLKDLVK